MPTPLPLRATPGDQRVPGDTVYHFVEDLEEAVHLAWLHVEAFSRGMWEQGVVDVMVGKKEKYTPEEFVCRQLKEVATLQELLLAALAKIEKAKS